MAIFLVRHGETAANAARVFQTPDVPLSERGVLQAQRLGARLAGLGVARVVSSDFVRASMTAEAVAASCGAPVALDPLLQERHFGELRGSPYAGIDYDPFAPDFAPPGGETWEAFHERVARAWQRVVRAGESALPGNLAVVTHGLVCHALARRHLAVEPGSREILRFRNTALTVIDGGPPWRASLLGCVAHLEDASG